jgi:glycosyltransferase involved in cell wall biosynthesis
MLNVVSRSLVENRTRGPQKVVRNTLRGLDALGVPYVVNRALNATDQLWIHDDPAALRAVASLPASVKVLAGPNVFTVPAELPKDLPTDRVAWLHPSLWVQEFWQTFGAAHVPSLVWPVGIDTETFSPSENKKDLVLVYNKMRNCDEVEVVAKTLTELREPYQVLTYGHYHEDEYRGLLARAKLIVWVGRSESQGIALLEALATGTPALVWDITYFGQWEGKGKERFTPEQLAFQNATTAPYFSPACGERVTSADEVLLTLRHMLSQLGNYAPRSYVTEHLSLTGQATALLACFETQFGLSEAVWRDGMVRSTKPWRNATLPYQLFSRGKGALRRFLG